MRHQELVERFFFGQVLAIVKGLDGRFAIAIFPTVSALMIVGLYLLIDVELEFFDGGVKVSAKSAGIKLVLDRLMEALTDAVCLG